MRSHAALPSGKTLALTDVSAQRINETIEPGQGIGVELIESEILGWMEMGEYQSEEMSEAQTSKMERDVMKWIKSALSTGQTP